MKRYSEYPFILYNSFKNKDFHQSILDVGYCWWQNNIVNSYADMIEKMISDFGEPFALLILLGKYNQQVGNGGHSQYLLNGYASKKTSGAFSTHKDLDLHILMIKLLLNDEYLKNNKLREDVIKILEESEETMESLIESENEDCDQCDGEGYFPDDDREEDCAECDGSGKMNIDFYYRLLEILDTKYYKINDEWMDILNEYAKFLIVSLK